MHHRVTRIEVSIDNVDFDFDVCYTGQSFSVSVEGKKILEASTQKVTPEQFAMHLMSIRRAAWPTDNDTERRLLRSTLVEKYLRMIL